MVEEIRKKAQNGSKNVNRRTTTEAMRIPVDMADFIRTIAEGEGISLTGAAKRFYDEYTELKLAKLLKEENNTVQERPAPKVTHKNVAPVERMEKVEKKERKPSDHSVKLTAEEREAFLQEIEADVASSGVSPARWDKLMNQMHGVGTNPKWARNHNVSKDRFERIVAVIRNGRGF